VSPSDGLDWRHGHNYFADSRLGVGEIAYVDKARVTPSGTSGQRVALATGQTVKISRIVGFSLRGGGMKEIRACSGGGRLAC